MSLVKLTVEGLSSSPSQNGAYVLILSEEKNQRRLPIVIGGFEAQSIVVALDKDLQPPRPLTHDLLSTIAKKFDIDIKQIIIHKLIDGIFYSSIILERDGIEEIFDARNSDAVAIAIRFGAPIFTYENILEKASIMIDDKDENNQNIKFFNQEQEDNDFISKLRKLSIKQLNDLLDQAVEKENYETAGIIRDMINSKNNSAEI